MGGDKGEWLCLPKFLYPERPLFNSEDSGYLYTTQEVCPLEDNDFLNPFSVSYFK